MKVARSNFVRRFVLVPFGALAALAGLTALAQDPAPGGLRPVQDGSKGLERVPDAAGADAEALASLREEWQGRLLIADLDLRERAFDELVARAAEDDAARLMLEEWSVDPHQGELAWTARLALRQLDCVRVPFARRMVAPQFPGAPFGSDLEARLRALLGDPFGGAGAHPFLAPDWAEHFESFFGEPFGGQGFAPFAPGFSGGTARGESFQLRVGPDGVHCEITECEDGKEEKKVYEADSVEELLEAHPELEGRMGNPAVPQVPQAPEAGGDAATVRTDILGIQFGRPTLERTRALGLPDGRGVVVEVVWPRTIAAAVGLRRGDVILRINDQPIADGSDISRILAERSGERELLIAIESERGQRRELVWRP